MRRHEGLRSNNLQGPGRRVLGTPARWRETWQARSFFCPGPRPRARPAHSDIRTELLLGNLANDDAIKAIR
eukprot:6197469-Pleurochrysis_carterae.AAC.4